MKKNYYLLAMLLVSSLTFFSACSDDDDNGGGDTDETVKSVTLDATAYDKWMALRMENRLPMRSNR